MAVDLDSTIADLYAAGESVSQLARRFSLKPRDVVNILRRFNLYASSSNPQKGGHAYKGGYEDQRSSGGRRPPNVQRKRDDFPPSSSAGPNQEDSAGQKILALYSQGMSPDEIVRITGRRRHMVIFTLHKAGLHLKPQETAPQEEQIPEPAQVSSTPERVAEHADVAVSAEPVPRQVHKPVPRQVETPRRELSVSKKEPSEERTSRWSPEVIGAVEKIAIGYYSRELPEAEIKAMIDTLNRRPLPKTKTKNKGSHA
jgi:hypothetical protein